MVLLCDMVQFVVWCVGCVVCCVACRCVYCIVLFCRLADDPQGLINIRGSAFYHTIVRELFMTDLIAQVQWVFRCV